LFRVHRSTSRPSSSVAGVIPPSSARLSRCLRHSPSPPPPQSTPSQSASPLSLRYTPYSFCVFAVAVWGRIYLFPARTYPRSWTSAALTPSWCPSSVASASPYLASLQPHPCRSDARRCPSSPSGPSRRDKPMQRVPPGPSSRD
jgi:hypothetical protein